MTSKTMKIPVVTIAVRAIFIGELAKLWKKLSTEFNCTGVAVARGKREVFEVGVGVDPGRLRVIELGRRVDGVDTDIEDALVEDVASGEVVGAE